MQKRNIHYNLLGTVSFIFIAAVWLSVLPFFIQEQKTGAIFVEDRDVENVVGFLEKHLTQQDVVVVSNCANARYWYYSDHFHLNRSSFREVKNRPFRHAYVLVYRTCKDKFDQPETAQSVMQEFGPDRNFLNQDTLHQIAHFGNVTVYDILANSKTIQDTYGKVK